MRTFIVILSLFASSFAYANPTDDLNYWVAHNQKFLAQWFKENPNNRFYWRWVNTPNGKVTYVIPAPRKPITDRVGCFQIGWSPHYASYVADEYRSTLRNIIGCS